MFECQPLQVPRLVFSGSHIALRVRGSAQGLVLTTVQARRKNISSLPRARTPTLAAPRFRKKDGRGGTNHSLLVCEFEIGIGGHKMRMT